MKILSIDTSCDETAAAVIMLRKESGGRGLERLQILSNIVWSQMDLHTAFGGVVPSIAQRAHTERIDRVVDLALSRGVGHTKGGRPGIDAVAVTVGPGLAIALEVGIRKARELAWKWKTPLIPVNHTEGHVLSTLVGRVNQKDKESMPRLRQIVFPAVAMVVSGAHTEILQVERIGRYKIIASTTDDALGEALDKAARMLGLGYPGGAILEKMAREGDFRAYPLPLPMAGKENRGEFSYSGLKTAFMRLVAETGNVTVGAPPNLVAQQIKDLAAVFQNKAFEHLTRVTSRSFDGMGNHGQIRDFLVGGGVSANLELRKRLRALGKKAGMRVWFPLTSRLCGDNAAMVGIAACFKYEKGEYLTGKSIETADRQPRMKIDSDFVFSTENDQGWGKIPLSQTRV